MDDLNRRWREAEGDGSQTKIEQALLNRIDFLRTEVQAWLDSSRALNALYQKERLNCEALTEQVHALKMERDSLAEVNIALSHALREARGC